MARSRRGGRTWSSLSKPYRQRLLRAGIDRQAWLRGADLRTARSHAPRPPAGAAPPEVTARVLRGEGTRADLAELKRWSRTADTPPGMSYDTAAALSQVPIPRSQWGHVHFYPRADGQPWTMTITPKRHMRADGTVRTHAYDITVQIPGVEGPGSGAEEVLDDLSESDIDYDVGYEPTGR